MSNKSKNKKSRQKKKQQFEGKDKGVRRVPKGYVAGAAVVIVAVIALILIFSQTGGEKDVATDESPNIEMTSITATVDGGKITVPLKEVKDNTLVTFAYEGDQSVPLLAYEDNSGKIVTAISVCEPCNGTEFHIDGDTLVCNTCGTIWELSTHKGISGGCIDYPPEILESEIVGDNVEISEDLVKNWKPRE